MECVWKAVPQKRQVAVFILGFLFGFVYKTYTNRENTLYRIVNSGRDIPKHMRSYFYAKVHPYKEPLIKENSEASDLVRKIKILCLIFTYKKNHYKKAIHVNATWAQHCNDYLFITDKNEEDLPTIAVDVPVGRKYLWRKTRKMLQIVYKQYHSEYDWFYKADDDTFAILENMRYILSSYDPEDSWYLGCRFKRFVKRGYMSGGAGYALSRQALKKLLEEGLNNSSICNLGDGESEDVELGRCMSKLNIHYGETVDLKNRHRFIPVNLSNLLVGSKPNNLEWVSSYLWHGIQLGNFNCCSNTAVTIHYVKPSNMYLLNYFLYHFYPYGTSTVMNKVPDFLNIS